MKGPIRAKQPTRTSNRDRSSPPTAYKNCRSVPPTPKCVRNFRILTLLDRIIVEPAGVASRILLQRCKVNTNHNLYEYGCTPCWEFDSTESAFRKVEALLLFAYYSSGAGRLASPGYNLAHLFHFLIPRFWIHLG